MTNAGQHNDLPAFFHLIAMDEVASTNDEALALASGGAHEGTLITARRQTKGRGRRGRTWQSDEGNLFLSLILKPEGGPVAAQAVSFAAALAINDAISGLMGQDAGISLKWPNDVLIGGRKASGLMIERAGVPSEDTLILGVGINLVSHPTDTPYPATDLAAEGAEGISVAAALGEFSHAFLKHYLCWKDQGFSPLREAWLARAEGIGAGLSVDIEGRRFDGIFRTIDETGALCLDLGRGAVKKITAGDVYFRRPPENQTC